jgi:hypothetical protein
MMGYGPASFHDLFFDDEPLSEGSSVSDLLPLGCPALQEYGMADVQGRQPFPVETEDTHTPLDPHAKAQANAQAQGEDLRQRRQHQPPPASVHPRHNSQPNARTVVGSARACSRQV